jgi:hypothetical protein
MSKDRMRNTVFRITVRRAAAISKALVDEVSLLQLHLHVDRD